MRSLCFPLLLVVTTALFAHGQEQHPETDTRLAPGYGELSYTPPAAGSYRLPPLGSAADGAVLLDSGKPARLHELFAGHIVLLSFIYTQCSDVNGCPLATMVLQRLNAQIAADPELGDQIRIISLSFDPARDTPQALRNYRDALGSQLPANWSFVTTASETALAPILDDYGQTIIKRSRIDGGSEIDIAHNLRVMLIDRERRIRNIYSVDFLHPAILRNDIRTLLLEEQSQTDTVAGPLTGTAHHGPGDDKQGYEAAGYITRSSALTARTGQSINLLQFVREPPLGLPPAPIPETNPITAAKVSLGRRLFFDRRLSLNDTISCAMCHIPEQGFANNELATAVGFEGRSVRRNAPSLYNVAYQQRLFHDAREFSLEYQIWAPLLASNEMANPAIGAVLEKIRTIPDYDGLFEQTFDGQAPNIQNLGMALASYQRTLVSANSAFDRWYYGGDQDALSASAQRGFALFSGKAACVNCHTIGEQYALFSDQQLHNTGIGWYSAMKQTPAKRKVQLAPGVFVDVDQKIIEATGEKPANDLGRYEITQNPMDRWRYKTPSLRNIALTSPYMHDGSLSSLREVIEFYNQGAYANELLDPLIRPLQLSTTEIDDLEHFLKALTGSNVTALVSDAFSAPIGDPGRAPTAAQTLSETASGGASKPPKR